MRSRLRNDKISVNCNTEKVSPVVSRSKLPPRMSPSLPNIKEEVRSQEPLERGVYKSTTPIASAELPMDTKPPFKQTSKKKPALDPIEERFSSMEQENDHLKKQIEYLQKEIEALKM